MTSASHATSEADQVNGRHVAPFHEKSFEAADLHESTEYRRLTRNEDTKGCDSLTRQGVTPTFSEWQCLLLTAPLERTRY